MVKAEERTDLAYGDLVAFPWGTGEVKGTVREVYGPKGHKHVVVNLTPEITGSVVDEPTTVSMPIEDVRKVAPAV